MPSYATQAHLVERYGEEALLVIADRDHDDVVDTAIVDGALADASAEIDTYLAAKYQLPLPYVPEVLVRICADITIYRLSAEADMATEERRKRYEDAIKLLRAISRGEASLGMPDPPPSSNGGVTLIGPGRRFNRKNMRRLT